MKKLPDQVVSRFAPSPTGALHLGHLYSALFARRQADTGDGEMRLRIDDIDFTRCRPEYTEMIYDDLDFMGIGFDGEVMVQSERQGRYKSALQGLADRGIVYPCYLTRRELNSLLSAPHGKDQIIRNTDALIAPEAQKIRQGTEAPAWRLRIDTVRDEVTALSYVECGEGSGGPRQIPVDLSALGDVVIARKDIGTSYHLSVVLDDHDSGVTLVTRGDDLKPSTPLHRLLQHLLGLDETWWAHHPLITDDGGKRLAKRDSARSIRQLRKQGSSRNDILAAIEKLSNW
jgi:glutamyl-Q tRNA(Asp) synthetase